MSICLTLISEAETKTKHWYSFLSNDFLRYLTPKKSTGRINKNLYVPKDGKIYNDTLKDLLFDLLFSANKMLSFSSVRMECRYR